jgi:PAS domain S-box-containing protein
MLGYNISDVIGKPIEFIIPQRFHDIHKIYRKKFKKCPVNRSMGTIKTIVGLHKEQYDVHIDVSLQQLQVIFRNKSEPTKIIMSILRDLSEHIMLENNFNSILSAAPDGILVLNNRGIILNTNKQVHKLFGYSSSGSEQLQYKNITTLMPLFDMKSDAKEQSFIAIKKDLTEFPVSLSINHLYLNNTRNTIVIIRDITSQTEIENQLVNARKAALEASSAKSDFLSSMSHEIRTPLHGVLGFTNLLESTQLTTEQQEYIDSIKSCLYSVTSIINNVLDLSKLVYGKVTLNYSQVDMLLVIKQVRKLCHVMLEKNKNIEYKDFIINPDSNSMLVIIDVERVKQVVLNLLSNAVKFTKKGYIYLTYDMMKAKIKISIEDTGAGMTELTKSKIFNMFEQGEIAKTREFGGTGLGLVITQRLVEQMGGEIGYESEPEIGSKFWVVIPLSPKSGEAVLTSPVASKKQLGKATAANILLVEDNAINMRLASTMLRKLGHNVTTASDGLEALRCFSLVPQPRFDIVLMDVQMPNMDGFETTKILRQKYQIKCPIIALTASTFIDDVNNCLNSGMNDHLGKPYTQDDLLRKLNKWLEVHGST